MSYPFIPLSSIYQLIDEPNYWVLHFPFHEAKPSIPKIQLGCQFFWHMFIESELAFDNFLEIVNSFSIWSLFLKPFLCFSSFLNSLYKGGIYSSKNVKMFKNFFLVFIFVVVVIFRRSTKSFLGEAILVVFILYYYSMTKALICWWR